MSSSTTSPSALHQHSHPHPPPQSGFFSQHMPLKQKMALSLKSLMSSLVGVGGGASGSAPPSVTELFAKTDPAIDGDECLHDCDSCTVKYPRSFKTEMDDVLYGQIKEWSTHVIVGTGKTDWVRDVADEKGSVMEAIEKADDPTNGRMMLSASNMPTPHDTSDYSEPTTVLLLPAFTLVDKVHPQNVPQLITEIVNHAPTSTTPLGPLTIPASLAAGPDASVPALTTRDCPHAAVILMCSHRTRDARCGQSAPLLRKELERHLRPLGLYRDLHDERPGGVGIYFINHVGGHKYSANMMIYRRPNAFGLDDTEEKKETKETTTNGTNGHAQSNGHTDSNGTESANGTNGTNGVEKTSNGTNGVEKTSNGTNGVEKTSNGTNGVEKTSNGETKTETVGAAQGIWLARVRPEDCENLVRYTILRGKLVKPELQLRGGFDRAKGLMSW